MITRLEVDIDSVFPNSWNPNVEDPMIFTKVKSSIQEFGFLDPLLVREIEKDTYEIIGGEHRWKAAKELNFTKILVDNMGKVPDSRAKTLTILANIKGQDEALKLAKLIHSIDPRQKSLLPFDDKHIEELEKMLDYDFSQFEGAEVPDEDQDQRSKVLNYALHLERAARKLHEDTKSTKLRLFLEQYFEWLRILKTMISL